MTSFRVMSYPYNYICSDRFFSLLDSRSLVLYILILFTGNRDWPISLVWKPESAEAARSDTKIR